MRLDPIEHSTRPFVMNDNIIIGNGLIAREFRDDIKEDHGLCIFASGVSNSTCEDTSEFERESALLRSVMSSRAQGRVLIYFSTCSVYDLSQHKSSMYIRHKTAMEAIVKNHPGFYIFRLPQVVGHTKNTNTLTNFLKNSIIDSRKIYIQKFATRNIIDVHDAAKLARTIVASNSHLNQTINIANLKSDSVIDIVKIMEKVLGREAVYELVAAGYAYSIDTTITSSIIEHCNINFDATYTSRTLSKYYSI